MTTLRPEEDEKTLVSQTLSVQPEDHSTWPAPPLSPISSNPPPEMVVPPEALRAPALPAGLFDAQLQEDDSSE